MKPLVLHVGIDPSLSRTRLPRLLNLCNITSVTPEQAIFTIVDTQFAAAIICCSVPKRKAMTLVRFIERVAPELPVILLRTGRERQPLVPATYYVMQAEENVVLSALIERLGESNLIPFPARPAHRKAVAAS